MSILFNTGVINVKGTPSIITDTFANRPQATSMQMGTIFFSTDTFNIFQVVPFGSTQAWAVMGGGGGGTQNLDNVLYQGGTFTNDRLSDLNNYGWELYNFSYFNLRNLNNNQWNFTDASLKYYNTDNINTFFSINYTNGEFAMGDFGGTINGTHMNIDVPFNRIYFAPAGYLSALFTPHEAILGDGFNSLNSTIFRVHDIDKLVNINFAGHVYFNLNNSSDFIYYDVGDFNNDVNGTHFSLNDEEAIINMRADSYIQFTTNQLFFIGNVLQTSSGSTSGYHLQIWVNGTQYVIELKNP